jgi:hypothetical protein
MVVAMASAGLAGQVDNNGGRSNKTSCSYRLTGSFMFNKTTYKKEDKMKRKLKMRILISLLGVLLLLTIIPTTGSTETPSTYLLFTFVTNQQGFDTGIAISNTGKDPFGTIGKAGTCTFSFYGANAPANIVSSSIVQGTTYTLLASTTAPNFQGYMIASCDFPFAQGFAFISDFGARNLAMGYLAPIISNPRTPYQ